MQKDSFERRKKEFLVLGVGILMLGISVYFAISYLTAELQFPILLFSFGTLILISRRILKLEGYFISARESWSSELARFREQNK